MAENRSSREHFSNKIQNWNASRYIRSETQKNRDLKDILLRFQMWLTGSRNVRVIVIVYWFGRYSFPGINENTSMIAIQEARNAYVNKKSCFTIVSYSFFLPLPSHQSRRPSYLFTSLWISCIRRFVLTSFANPRIKKVFFNSGFCISIIFQCKMKAKRIENSFRSFFQVKHEE